MTPLPRRALAHQSGKALLGLGGAFLASCLPAQASSASPGPACAPSSAGRVKTGFEKLREGGYAPLLGHKVGVIANVASVDNTLTSIVDCLHLAPSVRLHAIFGPEHGFRGSMKEGFSEPETQDPETGCTVYDIYAKTGDALKSILKKSGITLLIFDIQDTGSRFYTYIWTLFDCMMACAELGLPLLVLDRPNPISGLNASGPVLDPRLASFVGRAPIALRHGMTVAELARLFNAVFIPEKAGQKASLDIIPMEGWQRGMFFEETGLTWCPPSPNMPTPLTALVYPGTCLFEGSRFSVGRGTTMPFLYLGGEDVDGHAWATAATKAGCTGVAFQDVWFTPLVDPFKNTLLHGLHCAVTDRTQFDPVATGMTLLSTARRLAGPSFWRGTGKTFDQLSGNTQIRLLLDKGADATALAALWEKDLAAFRALRQTFLLY
ncbi:exo-beta-N-acetylmuramidase NamZ family protein [Acetobacter orleanensis]|uniref:DUF1343 domain-containing protein n=1 Tax=Acetobacter orleanensis TaxID=104099 RepID=A0A4Y3TRN7_9PROT|nr:DUF1343 domain-containing protein [Acetobacter orleanensis]KXV66230.1 hypothetical protein AD949_02970 [Acetobacter orleanensis]PCD78578.1 DUF1343 domain-containing protein [Acetobacter orleanensis]GAN69897.1 hypothetical protein Abol_221_026 [Acetobacter orleanensis JCM 7639]GBR31010.1 hypothetical protein AA0473_2423 [Acetobacter orleanensis NRIC 0473]GEB83670.1 hypothetical protein AOR01nite_21470 [Acetobacter orleanensis]